MSQFKGSTNLLNLRKQQEHLAKQKNYAEAHQLQQHANAVEEGERQKFAENVEKQIQAAEANLIGRQ